MAKDPAFLFYVSDFLTGTMFMNNDQVGIYIRLLCSQHQHGGLIDKKSFDSLVGQNTLVRDKFIETERGYYNQRLTTEMEKRNKKSNNLSLAAKEIWAKRKENEAIAIQSHNNSNTIVQNKDTIVIESKDVDINKDIVDIKKGITEKKFNFKKSLIEYGFKESLVDDWLLVRANKKATNSKTAFDAFIKEVESRTIQDLNTVLEICCEKSWSGFKYQWVDNLEQGNNGNTKTPKSEPFNLKAVIALNNAIEGKRTGPGADD